VRSHSPTLRGWASHLLEVGLLVLDDLHGQPLVAVILPYAFNDLPERPLPQHALHHVSASYAHYLSVAGMQQSIRNMGIRAIASSLGLFHSQSGWRTMQEQLHAKCVAGVTFQPNCMQAALSTCSHENSRVRACRRPY